MAEDAKTFVFDTASKNSMDPTALLALMNNNGGFGGNMSWIWVIFLFFLYGWRGNGFFGGNNGELGRDFDTSTLLNAISGNGNAISNLATSLNCSVGQIQNAITALNSSVSSVGNQVGMSGMQVINAIQAGNQTLASQLAQCCCDNKLLVTSQGYENQLATLNQTNQLSNKIDGNTSAITSAIAAQTVEMNNQFCALKERDLQNKIDALISTNNALQNSISNANQTAAIQSYIAGIINPLALDVAAIKSSQPPTVAVPYPQLTAVPSAYALGGCYNGALFTNGNWA